MSYVEEMKWRGLVNQASDPRLGELMDAEKFTLYCGFDPSAPSLHVGNLMPILGLRRAQLQGHQVIALVGGATGIIGDPSGKSAERNLLSYDVLERNQVSIRKQLERLLDFSRAEMLNNFDWFRTIPYLEFLRDTGKHFTVNTMLAKESVQARIQDRENGISYTEFSYMLIQAYDYLWLFDHRGCRLQIGGSEQWGNITAGIELIRRKRGKEAYALTLPLLLDSAGKKFGKTEKGAVFLEPSLTSVYDFFQYFLRADDRDVPKLLSFLTLLDQRTIGELEEQVRVAPQKREAQRVLARQMTTLVHGAEHARIAEEAAAALFGAAPNGGAPAGAPSFEVSAGSIAEGYLLVDALAQSGLCRSKSDARREIDGGGIYVNDERVQSLDHRIGLKDVREGVILLRRGKKNYMVLKIGTAAAQEP